MVRSYRNIKRVLVAEDSEDLRDLLQMMVERLNIECIAVPDGLAAIAELKKGPFDLLITDFRMPNTDGVELLEWCRKSGIHMPVIFVSANADLVSREQVALSDCCATLMLKPIDYKVFLAAIEAAENRSHHKDCVHVQSELMGAVRRA